jgi:hypothetical protein
MPGRPSGTSGLLDAASPEGLTEALGLPEPSDAEPDGELLALDDPGDASGDVVSDDAHAESASTAAAASSAVGRERTRRDVRVMDERLPATSRR